MKASNRGAKFGLAYYDRPREGQTPFQWRVKRLTLSMPAFAKKFNTAIRQFNIGVTAAFKMIQRSFASWQKAKQRDLALSGPLLELKKDPN